MARESRPSGGRSPARTREAFSAEEQAAMKARARELKAEARAGKDRAAGEQALREAIAAMPPQEQALARALHALVAAAAPSLLPRTWYGMPAWTREGKVLCFFQAASKFKTRYATFGFTDEARLDDGDLWACAFALTRLGPAEQARVRALLEKALG